MLFLTLMTLMRPEKAGEQRALLKRLATVTPPAGIRVLGVYLLFGRFNAAIVFEAPDLKMAENFTLKIVGLGLYRMETLPAIDAREL